jgi:hypothetical protein
VTSVAVASMLAQRTRWRSLIMTLLPFEACDRRAAGEGKCGSRPYRFRERSVSLRKVQ